MKIKYLIQYMTALALYGQYHPIQAQNSVSVSNETSISIDITRALLAGKNIESVADSTQWLNYSMVVNPADPSA